MMKNQNISHLKKRKVSMMVFLSVILFLCVSSVCFLSPAAVLPFLLSEEGESAVDANAWNLILVNQNHQMPENYRVELTELANGTFVDSRIYPSLQEMFDDMRNDGLYPVVASGYRSRERQQELLEEKIAAYIAAGYDGETARRLGREVCALPGFSEHELGSAVDINADPLRFGGEDVYRWLGENAWKYGFIYRYPRDKTSITGIADEPWHYRYVGKAAAGEITRRGLCLEEYLAGLT